MRVEPVRLIVEAENSTERGEDHEENHSSPCGGAGPSDRACQTPVEVMVLGRESPQSLVRSSGATAEEIATLMRQRLMRSESARSQQPAT